MGVMRDGPLFSGEGLDNYQKNNFLHNEKCWKKIVQREPWEKNRAIAFNHPGPDFLNVLKLFLNTLMPSKKNMHNHTVSGKLHAAENCPTYPLGP